MTGIEIIAEERQRQISAEGWNEVHDDQHTNEELTMAAACYAAPENIFVVRNHPHAVVYGDPWPWDRKWDKRKKHNRLRQLAIAGALIAAEIDRLQRAG